MDSAGDGEPSAGDVQRNLDAAIEDAEIERKVVAAEATTEREVTAAAVEQDAVAAALVLAKNFDALTRNVKRLHEQQQNSKFRQSVLAFALAGFIAIGAIGGYLLHKETSDNHQAAVNTCLTNNTSRSGNQALWDYAITTLAGPDPSPANQVIENHSLARVAHTFEQRNCKAIK